MQIHELPTGTIGSTEYSPIDNGTSNRKITFASIGDYIINTLKTLNGATKSVGEYISELNSNITPSEVSSPVSWDTTNTVVASSDAKMYKIGNLRILQISILPAIATGVWTTYGTISSGNRPMSQIITPISTVYPSDDPHTVRITTSGAIQLNQNPSTSHAYSVCVAFSV